MARKAVTQKPGERSKQSGQAIPVGPRGGQRGDERTIVKGNVLPPTPESGLVWKVIDPTKNGAGKK